jgi:hypothetical protein
MAQPSKPPLLTQADVEHALRHLLAIAAARFNPGAARHEDPAADELLQRVVAATTRHEAKGFDAARRQTVRRFVEAVHETYRREQANPNRGLKEQEVDLRETLAAFGLPVLDDDALASLMFDVVDPTNSEATISRGTKQPAVEAVARLFGISARASTAGRRATESPWAPRPRFPSRATTAISLLRRAR